MSQQMVNTILVIITHIQIITIRRTLQMGKKKKLSAYDATVRSIADEQRKLEKRLKEIPIDCSHVKKSGMLSGEFRKGEMFRCNRCREEFSFGNISSHSLREAETTLKNAINQMKTFTENPEADQETIHKLGLLAYNISEFIDIYERASKEEYKKKNKKKDKRRNNEGYGGYGNLSFLEGKKKKKKDCWD